MYRTVTLTLIMLVAFVSCKKNDENKPSQPYHIVSMQYNFQDKELTIGYHYTYENGKLVLINSDGDRVYFVRHMDYVNDNQINTLDSVNENNEQVIYTGRYLLQNGLITQFSFSQPYVANTAYTYTDGLLTESLISNASMQPETKNVYTYENKKLATYSQYSYAEDKGTWELWLKNEYTWNNNTLAEIINYSAMFDPSDFQIRTKMIFESQDGLPVKGTMYSRGYSEEWEKVSDYIFSYNEHGYLDEVKNVMIVNDTLIEYYVLSFQYEAGESNMEMFNKTFPEKSIYGEYLPPQFMITAY